MPHRKLREIVAGQALVYVSPDTSVSDAVKAMQAHQYSCVPVLENGNLLGIFTSTSLVKRVLDANRDPAATRVGEVMTPNPKCVDADCQGIEAVHLMKDEGIRHVVVRGCGTCGYAVVTAADFPESEIDEIEEELEFEQRLWEEL